MKNEISIDVNCNLNVDDSTVGACLKLVEIYLNNHKGYSLKTAYRLDGTTILRLVEMK